MARIIELFFYLLIPAFILLHIFVAPYSKVEESFNLQAIHDILVHGLPWKGDASNFFQEHYDHVSFPGSVPRTFAGALGLAGLVKPLTALKPLTTMKPLVEWKALAEFVGFELDDGSSEGSLAGVQMLVRCVLGLLNAFALMSFGRSVRRVFGVSAGIWYALLQASQFHVIYYASRTLPNMFAFAFSTMALKALLDASFLPMVSRSKYRRCLFLLTVAGVVFRSELAILVATITLYHFLNSRLSLFADIIPAGLGGLITGLLITVPVDSFFWQSFPIWPEWTAFYYNTIQGHSADWGVSPGYFYFTSALPRLMLNPLTYLLCIPVATLNPALRPRSLDLLVPLISFVAVYSILPHKEARFVLYTIPGLTGVASAGASWLWTRRMKSFSYAILSVALVASILLSFLASTGLLLISSLNYPGGHALTILHERIAPGLYQEFPDLESGQKHYRVYLDNLATQTGVTRFLEDHSTTASTANPEDPLAPHLAPEAIRRWTYDKTEDSEKLRDPLFWYQFDYVLTEKPGKTIGKWTVEYMLYGYSGIRVLKPGEQSPQRNYPFMEWTTELTAGMWDLYGSELKDTVFRGWWVEIKMEPKIMILKRQKDLQETDLPKKGECGTGNGTIRSIKDADDAFRGKV